MKEKIMHKAIELFSERGFDKVSVDEICKECGVTKGAFYHHYKSKHIVILAYFQDVLSDNQDVFIEIVIEKSIVEQIWKLVSHIIKSILKIGRNLTQEMLVIGLYSTEHLLPVGGEYQNENLDNLLKLILKLIEKGQELNEIDSKLSSVEIFKSFMFSILGITYLWCSKNREEFKLDKEVEKSFNVTFNKEK